MPTIRDYFTYYKTELYFYAGFLTILGVAFFIQSVYVDSMWSAAEEPPTRALIINVFVDRLVAAYLWLLFTPFIILVSEKISSRSIGLMPAVLLHTVAGLFFTMLHIPVYSAYIFLTHAVAPWMYASVFEKMEQISFFEYLVGSFGKLNHVYRLLYYCIIIAIHFSFDYFRKYSERELRASQLEVQLKEAQLRTLFQQLQPHFLFNTLNGISSLMYKSIDDADRMLTYLGDLLRISLERMNVPEVPLRDDIAFIDRYLLIEQTRMGDRLQVTQDFQSDTLEAMVPCMILQPILENAIRHGISPHIRTGVIAVSSRRDGDRLILQVEDNGNGMDGVFEERLTKGLGIKNTMERLTHLYNNNQSIRFTPTPGGGLTVTLSLPFRIQSE